LSVRVSQSWLSHATERQALSSAFNRGEHWLLVKPESNDNLYILRKLDSPDRDHLVKSLTTISQLRKKGDAGELLKGATSQHALVSLYCLSRLLDLKRIKALLPQISELNAQKDDPKQSPIVRMLSNRLTLKASGAIDPLIEYRWIKGAISEAATADPRQISWFVHQLIGFTNRRTQTAAFLISLVQNLEVRLSIRIAAYGGFANAKLFNFHNPDHTSKSCFEACVRMLSDPESKIRSAGAALLARIVSRIDPDKRGAFAGEARAAILEAIKREANRVTVFHLKTYLEHIRA
jgi:hypothetical protein